MYAGKIIISNENLPPVVWYVVLMPSQLFVLFSLVRHVFALCLVGLSTLHEKLLAK